MAGDIALFRTSTNPAAQYLFAPNDSGAVVDGKQWLAQQVVTQLLKRKGFVPHTTDGSSLMENLRTARVRSEADLFMLVNMALRDVSQYLRNNIVAADPLTKRLKSVVATRLLIQENDLVVELLVTNQSSETQSVQLPVRFAIGR